MSERRRKDVGLYENEKNILLGMFIELGGAIQVRFKLPEQDKEVILGDNGRFNDEVMGGGSLLLFNPDDMSSIHVFYRCVS